MRPGETPITQVVIHDYGDQTLVFEVRGLKTAAYKAAPIGVVFEGQEGYMVSASYDAAVFDKEGKLGQEFSGGGEAAHYNNFISAVRSRDIVKLNADILQGHISSALCHLGNISYRLGKPIGVDETKQRLSSLKVSDNVVETFDRTCQHLVDNGVDFKQTRLRVGPWLAFNPKDETFVDNSTADSLLTREYRSPFIVPSPGQV